MLLINAPLALPQLYLGRGAASGTYFSSKKGAILHAQTPNKTIDPAAAPVVPGRATQAEPDPSLFLPRRSSG